MDTVPWQGGVLSPRLWNYVSNGRRGFRWPPSSDAPTHRLQGWGGTTAQRPQEGPGLLPSVAAPNRAEKPLTVPRMAQSPPRQAVGRPSHTAQQPNLPCELIRHWVWRLDGHQDEQELPRGRDLGMSFLDTLSTATLLGCSRRSGNSWWTGRGKSQLRPCGVRGAARPH